MAKNPNSKSGDEDVGYRNPPKEHRWQKGTSGNPKGRPKACQNFETDVKETLKEQVTVTENGTKKTVSAQKASLLRLKEKALKGDARSLDTLLDLARIHNSEDLAAQAEEALDPLDQEILDDYFERRLAQEERRRAAEVTEPPVDGDHEEENHEDDEEDPDAWLLG